MTIIDYPFKIQYCKGKKYLNTDALYAYLNNLSNT